MRRFLPFVLLLAGLALVLAGAPEDSDANGGRSACASRGSTTVFSNAYGRFFTKLRRSVVPGRARYRAYFSCSHRYGKKFRLAEGGFEGEDEYTRLRIRGPFAAYAHWPSCGACEYRALDVRVQDLRTGRHRRVLSATGAEPQDGDSEDVTDLELKGNSAVAWIVVRERFESGTVTDRSVLVRAADRGGERLLDEGDEIDPDSLRLDFATSRVSWRHGAERRSTTLR